MSAVIGSRLEDAPDATLLVASGFPFSFVLSLKTLPADFATWTVRFTAWNRTTPSNPRIVLGIGSGVTKSASTKKIRFNLTSQQIALVRPDVMWSYVVVVERVGLAPFPLVKGVLKTETWIPS